MSKPDPQDFLSSKDMEALRRDMQSAIVVDMKTVQLQSRAAELRNFVAYLYARGYLFLSPTEGEGCTMLFMDEVDLGPVIDGYLDASP